MDFQAVSLEVGSFLWKKRINLSKKRMVAGPSKYRTLMAGIISLEPPDEVIIPLCSKILTVKIPCSFVEAAKLNPHYIDDIKKRKDFISGKLEGNEPLDYCVSPVYRFVVLPSAAVVENFIVCVMDGADIKYLSLKRLKELSIERGR